MGEEDDVGAVHFGVSDACRSVSSAESERLWETIPGGMRGYVICVNTGM